MEPPPSPAVSWIARGAELRERLSGRRGVAIALGVAGTLAAAVVVVLLLRTPAGPAPQLTLPRAAEAVPGTAAPGVPTTAPAAAAVSTVHAAGAVAKPGVYAVPPGARVADVLAAAGGPLPEADLDRLNLAAKVGDGDRVTVPRKGDPVTPEAPAGPGTGGPGPGSGGTGGSGGPVSGPIDLNTATLDQLDTLPGVGPATAQAIITYRTRNGRFRSVTELLEVPGIGPTKMEALRPLVRV